MSDETGERIYDNQGFKPAEVLASVLGPRPEGVALHPASGGIAGAHHLRLIHRPSVRIL
jgi:hypothetical protein